MAVSPSKFVSPFIYKLRADPLSRNKDTFDSEI